MCFCQPLLEPWLTTMEYVLCAYGVNLENARNTNNPRTRLPNKMEKSRAETYANHLGK